MRVSDNNMVVWRDVNAPTQHKCWHISKLSKRARRDFIKDSGDVPVVVFNRVANTIESVVNNRGIAYAARNRKMYRKGKYLTAKYTCI